MRRLAALLALLLTVDAHAATTTWWVSPTGTAGASGADSTTNAKSLASVNSGAQARITAGDNVVVRFKSGTYTDPIRPLANGTASRRIAYYGFASDPTAVTVSDIQFGFSTNDYGDYCTAQYFTVSGAMSGLTETSNLMAVSDSITHCRIPNSAGGFAVRSNFSVIDNCIFGGGSMTGSGQAHYINMYNESSTSYNANRITNCTFTVTVNTPSSGTASDVHILGGYRIHNNVIAGNTFNITVTNVGGPNNGSGGGTAHGYFFPVELYRSRYNSFQNNTYNLVMNATPYGTHSLFALRDTSSFNRFVGNTVTTTGPGEIGLGWNQAGSNPGTANSNYLGNNVFKLSNVTGSGVFYAQNGCRGDTIEFNVFATSSNSPALYVSSVPITNTIFRHNTFHCAGSNIVDMASVSSASGSRFVSNIFYGTGGGGASVAVIVPSGMGMDSLGVVFLRGASSANAIRYNGVVGAPGSGTTGYGLSQKAVWNTPRFTDSTYTTLNTTLLSGSPADDDNLHDGYAGAVGAATVDAVRPATVTPLAVTASSTSSITLGWTAVGDDSLTGTALAYDIRYSTSLITAANFNSATQASGLPVPGAPGATESFTVTGLPASTVLFFALKTGDGDNWSAISDTARCATTNAGDVTVPGTITDLAANPTGSTSMLVTWTQVGDDGTTPGDAPVASYTVKRSTSAINSGNFNAATTVAYGEQPDIAGQRAGFEDTGLSAATTYYYAAKGVDDAGNAGAISNLPSATTQAATDVTAPGQLTLTAPSVGANSVNLAWTAAGNDGASAGGAASGFDVRYRAGSTFVEGDWNGATTVLGEPTPGIPGTAHTMTVGGLSTATQYAFAIKADDLAGNHSTISAAVTATPTALTTAISYRRGRGRR